MQKNFTWVWLKLATFTFGIVSFRFPLQMQFTLTPSAGINSNVMNMPNVLPMFSLPFICFVRIVYTKQISGRKSNRYWNCLKHNFVW